MRMLCILVGILTIAGAQVASAAVLFTYEGKIDRLEYFHAPVDTPEVPFEIGQRVTASLFIDRLEGGSFIYQNGVLWVDLVLVGPAVATGQVQFGATAAGHVLPLDPFFATRGSFAPLTGQVALQTSYCCSFSNRREDGQADFNGGSFQAIYLPTGNVSDASVRAFGTGTWTAALVPEPASILVLGVGLAGLSASRRLRQRVAGRR